MKIYLAGKMDSKHGAWRDALLDRQDDDWKDSIREPYWKLVRPADSFGDLGEDGVPPWPMRANTRVLGIHEYVGPYRTTYDPKIDSKYTGYFHGSTVSGQHGVTSFDDHAAIVQQCWKAINRADLMFAYINSPDCFGTLAEIGMAKAIGVYVVAAFDNSSEWDWSDYWFCGQLCDELVGRSIPIEAGPEPKTDGVRWGDPAWREHDAWRSRRDEERRRIQRMLKDAIVAWTARPEKPAPVALVRHDETEPYIRALQEAASSLSQIARWSADPRVRNEAQRMLKRIAG